jgi:type III secretion system FlhB-like substrate exporter
MTAEQMAALLEEAREAAVASLDATNRHAARVAAEGEGSTAWCKAVIAMGQAAAEAQRHAQTVLVLRVRICAEGKKAS